MKKIILIILLAIPAISFSQGHVIKYSQLESAVDKDDLSDNTPKVAPGDAGFTKDAKITITGVASKKDSDKIALKNARDGSLIKGILENTSLVFAIGKDLLTPENNSFFIFFNGQQKGTLAFDVQVENDGGVSGKAKEKTDDPTSYVAAMANANFIGNNKFLSNLTPIVNLGTIINFAKWRNLKWDLDVNPYIGSEINAADSSSFIPSLMLYGRAGLGLNNYLSFGKEGGNAKLILMPFGFGLKLIPNIKDSNTVIIQHNLRTGFAIQYAKTFVIGVQYTYGFHNATSESKRFYKQSFGNNATDLQYLTVSGQFSVKGKTDDINNYVFIEWRGLLKKQPYSAFTNNAIITFGIRKDLSLSTVFASSTTASSTRGTVSKPSLPSRPLF